MRRKQRHSYNLLSNQFYSVQEVQEAEEFAFWQGTWTAARELLGAWLDKRDHQCGQCFECLEKCLKRQLSIYQFDGDSCKTCSTSVIMCQLLHTFLHLKWWTSLFDPSDQSKSVNRQEISNICYVLKDKDITRQVDEQQWFSKQGLQINKTQKAKDGYKGQTQQSLFWKQCQE